MRTFVQFKDGVAHAYVKTENETTGVEVFIEDVDSLMGCKLNQNGLWVKAEMIKYAICNENGQITEIRNTHFSSEVKNNHVMAENVQPNWIWNGTEFVAPTS